MRQFPFKKKYHIIILIATCLFVICSIISIVEKCLISFWGLLTWRPETINLFPNYILTRFIPDVIAIIAQIVAICIMVSKNISYHRQDVPPLYNGLTLHIFMRKFIIIIKQAFIIIAFLALLYSIVFQFQIIACMHSFLVSKYPSSVYFIEELLPSMNAIIAVLFLVILMIKRIRNNHKILTSL
jgi:hypothetical protein